MMSEKNICFTVFGTALAMFTVIIILELKRGVVLSRQDYGVRRSDQPRIFWRSMIGQLALFSLLVITFVCALFFA
jgi:hypothetical protein